MRRTEKQEVFALEDEASCFILNGFLSVTTYKALRSPETTRFIMGEINTAVGFRKLNNNKAGESHAAKMRIVSNGVQPYIVQTGVDTDGETQEEVTTFRMKLDVSECVRGADAGNGIRVFIPDIGMFVVGLVTWLLCRSLEKPPLKDVSQHNSDFEVDDQRTQNCLDAYGLCKCSFSTGCHGFPRAGLFGLCISDAEFDQLTDENRDGKSTEDDPIQIEKEDEEEDKKSEKQDLEDELLFEDFELGEEECALPEEEEVDAEDAELEEADGEESTKMRILRQIADVASKLKEIIGNLITTAGKVVITILLGLTGMMLPSLTSIVYFFTFLGLCTWWSFCRTFDPLLFSCLCVLMAIFSAGHLIMLYLYQFQFFQEAVPPGNSYARCSRKKSEATETLVLVETPGVPRYDGTALGLRLNYTAGFRERCILFGISPVVQTDCSHTWMFRVNPDLQWHHFVNPIMLLVLYYTLATLIRLWLQESEDVVKEKEAEVEGGEEPESPESNTDVYTADKKRQLWRMAHYRTDERNVLIVTSNGASLDFTSVAHENGPKSVELYSTPHYKPGQPEPEPQKMDCGVYKIDSTYVELSEVPQSFGVVRVNSVVKAFRFIMKQSYICALIAMMAWSITYVSWLTFVFLIWSCTLWMVRDRRKYSMITSPFMVFYGNLLIILQYIWSFESLQPVPGLFLKKEVPFRELGSKTLCLLSFWLLVRQFLTERRERQTDETQLSDVKVEGRTLGERDVVVYTMLVLILVYTFQFESSINVWSNMTGMSREKLEDLGLEKFSVPALFTRIFIPTSFLLVCILHLHYFHERFLELTDIKSVADKQKSTISRLVHLDGSLVDISMVKPTLNSSVNEEEVAERIDLEKEEEHLKQMDEEEISEPHVISESYTCQMMPDPVPDQGSELKSKWHLVVERLTVLFLKFLDYVQKLQLFIWWLLELHIIKIVSSYIIWVSVKEVSLFNYVFLVSWAFALPFSQFRPLASSVCTIWTCVIIVCKMLYQLTSINPSTYSKTCNMPDNYTEAQRMDMAKSLLYSGSVDPANWIGLRKFSPLLENLRNNLLMLALLAFEVTIYRHQDFYRMKNNLTPPVTRTIFHNITRHHLDDGIINCAKYFINYFFYKFGLETCFLLAVNVIGQRMDFYAMLHAFGLIAVMYQRRRKAIAHVWSKYCCFLGCMLAFQYLMCIGIPPAACTDYPWRNPSSSMDSNVIKWLYFPDFHTKPNSLFLLCE
ncbi:Piezo-type mechanosensitive ion channel component 2 [Anabarilius grahami]|uniref:Piezo-type mechanosensitive ion channel component 2 n=1 Tax=Anabarilius grahami TaxID=495550 RepID=A0A3N0XQA4_ANAGA|nr:Piezo-type mechanosensitive ion channel component 2 [Anabarilius grahami]